jgi:hypothetical protein
LVTALCTAGANEYRLDKELTGFSDTLDAFRLLVMGELIIINSIILEHISLWYHLAVVTHPLSHGPNCLLRSVYE